MVSTVRTVRVHADRALPEVSYLPGTPAEAVALAFIAARQLPVSAQGDGGQLPPVTTAPLDVSSLDCAGTVRAVPATFSGVGGP
jgi:hypothetical protein